MFQKKYLKWNYNGFCGLCNLCTSVLHCLLLDMRYRSGDAGGRSQYNIRITRTVFSHTRKFHVTVSNYCSKIKLEITLVCPLNPRILLPAHVTPGISGAMTHECALQAGVVPGSCRGSSVLKQLLSHNTSPPSPFHAVTTPIRSFRCFYCHIASFARPPAPDARASRPERNRRKRCACLHVG